MSKARKFFVFGLLMVSLITTSVGGAFATAALAASPEVAEQSNSKKDITTGLVALGLLALLTKGGGHGDSHDGGSKSTVPQQSPTQSGSTQNSTTSTQSGSTTTTTSQPASGNVKAAEQQALQLLNADRAANGLPALKLNPSLARLAENYAKDMMTRNYFSHYNPEGQSPFDRMNAAGIRYSYAGENIAINSSPAAAETAFMNSPGHRANILNTSYTDVGLGVAYDAKGQLYVVQEFIKP